MDFGGGLVGVGLGGSGFVGAPEAAGGGGGGVCFSPPMGSPSDAAGEPGCRAGTWGFGSGMTKPARTVCGPDDDVDWRYAKLPRSDDGCSASRAASSLFPDGQQMLSFSTTPKVAENLVLPGEGVLSCCYPVPSSASTSSSPPVLAAATSSSPAGMAYGANGSLSGNLYGLPTGMRGGVLPSPQWLELEQQALIYKYMDANGALPSAVLASVRAGYNPCGYNGYSAGSLAPGAFGWGSSLRQGLSDPEPGRCRRTDGKKWRCSRDAVADQKYCERHMNRGRHRSRKPVEGLSGHAKAMPVVAPMPSASAEAATSAAGGVTNNVGMMHHQQTKTMLSSSNMFSRNLINNEGETNHQIHDQQRLSMSISSNSEGLNVLNSYNPFEDQPSMETASGLMSSNNPLINLSNSCMSNRGYGTIPGTSEKEFDQPNLIHHFFDNWPKNQPHQSRNAWSDTEDHHVDRTQLSISMPAGSSALPQEKHSLAQLRLSREIDPIHIELGIGSGADSSQREQQATWGAPISWGASMGGPLGEVLNTTNNTCGGGDHMKNSSSTLNLMAEDWESSPQMGSTPTGVLQNTAFGSLASSAGSSPRADNFNSLENATAAGGRLCSDLIGSALINSTAIPTL